MSPPSLLESIGQTDLHDLEVDLDYVRKERACRADPWVWLATAVSTIDEADPLTPVKPFPTHACPTCARYHGGLVAQPCCGTSTGELIYLKQSARQFASASPPMLLIPKARRMRLTWLFVALHLRLLLSRPHARVFFVSSKEEKSAELVERATGILTRLPAWAGGGVRFAEEGSPPALRLTETDAAIIGIAEGADQLRQYTASAIFADEFGTWQWPRLAYSAMRPCIDGGGQLTILSSAYPGFWRDLVSGEALG